MTRGTLEPLSKMTDWQWKETMLRGCDMIDEILKDLEQPVINQTLKRKSFPRIAEDVPLLAKPPRRDVEVLVHAADKWWRQKPMTVGTTKTKIYLGNEQTKKGTEFSVIAMTTEKPLTNQSYPNLPDYRTKSDEIVVLRS